MGFLKISSSSVQPSKSEKVSELGSSVSSTKEQCPDTKSPAFIGETSKPFSKWRTESGSTAEPQQQTFFQKAHAKRLQKQYEQEETSGPYADKILKCLPTASTDNSAFIVTTHKAVDKTEENQTCTLMRSLHTDESASKADSSLSRGSKTQSSIMLQCFTCPVCFNQIETENLTSFNQHIDECLSGDLDNKRTSRDEGQDVGEEENLLSKLDEVIKDCVRHKVTDLSSASRNSPLKRNNESPYTSSSTPVKNSDCRTPFFKQFKSINEKHSLVPCEDRSDSGSVAFHKTASSVEVISESLDTKVSTLTCPVCNQAQDTDDLILFNRHVDMCLNQEVLLEFREAVPPMAQTESKVKGQCLR